MTGSALSNMGYGLNLSGMPGFTGAGGAGAPIWSPPPAPYSPPTVLPSLPLGAGNTGVPQVGGPFNSVLGSMLDNPFWLNQFARNPGSAVSAMSMPAQQMLSIFFPGAMGQ